MARYKDRAWNLPDSLTWEQVHVAMLMDVRDELKALNDELKALNRLLRCPNFLDMPHTLVKIERNTKKPKRRRIR